MISPLSNRKLLLAMLLSGVFTTAAQAQGNSAPSFKISTSSLKKQADSICSSFAANGYTLVEEIPVTMKSDAELPVIVNLKQGDWYQVVFIGDKHSQASEVSMYDYDEHKVVYKKNLASKDGNIITAAYVPQGSEYHLIRPVQHTDNQKRVLKGWFMLLQRPGASGAMASEKP